MRDLFGGGEYDTVQDPDGTVVRSYGADCNPLPNYPDPTPTPPNTCGDAWTCNG